MTTFVKPDTNETYTLNADEQDRYNAALEAKGYELTDDEIVGLLDPAPQPDPANGPDVHTQGGKDVGESVESAEGQDTTALGQESGESDGATASEGQQEAGSDTTETGEGQDTAESGEGQG